MKQVVEKPAGVCIEEACKADAKTLSFCKLHFAQFKHGTIKKNGLRPSDYERKLSQFEKTKGAYLK